MSDNGGDGNYLPTVAYLHDLAERLMRVPASDGGDGGDVDRIHQIASEIDVGVFNDEDQS